MDTLFSPPVLWPGNIELSSKVNVDYFVKWLVDFGEFQYSWIAISILLPILEISFDSKTTFSVSVYG